MSPTGKHGRRRVQLIHWNAADIEDKAAKLRAAGYIVIHELPAGSGALRKLSQAHLHAVVVDLSRRPSSGRDIALAIRSYKALRHVPIVFVGGETEKSRAIQELLPDALFTTWGRVRSSLKRALAHPPENPTVPRSVFAGYSGTTLPKKLGIKAGSSVGLAGAPKDFERVLGKLPADVMVRRQAGGRNDVTIWFARSRRELHERIERMVRHAENGGLWIVWPKKTSKLASDLSQVVVRQIGLATGLVDYKVCALDETWTGLKFTKRRAKK